MTLREEVTRALRETVKVDATGLAPVIASAYIVGLDEAADAAIAVVLERVKNIARMPMLPCTAGGDLILDPYTAETIVEAIDRLAKEPTP